jgi:putative ABC transport system permease protein
VTRFNLRLVSAFAALALLLAAVGIYGLTAGEVTSRWRELGVRLALGATRPEALWMVMRSSAIALSAGIVLGLALGSAVARVMKSLLYGVGPSDTLVFFSAPVLFAIVGLAGSALAALRVLRADPATILRME